MAVQVPQRVAVKHAQPSLGEHHHAMVGGVAHFLLHADEVTRLQEVQTLLAAVTQRLEVLAPALQQRVRASVELAFMDHGCRLPAARVRDV